MIPADWSIKKWNLVEKAEKIRYEKQKKKTPKEPANAIYWYLKEQGQKHENVPAKEWEKAELNVYDHLPNGREI